MSDWFDAPPGSEEYTDIEEVGHGAFSEVYRAVDKATGQTVALKHMHLDGGGQWPLHVQREVSALEAVHHPNIVSLLHIHEDGFGISLVLEYCLTSLWELLDRLDGEPLEQAVTKAVLQAVLQAVAACHAAGFAIRDVSPSNILVSPVGTVKLADFGQARPLVAPGGAAAAAAGGAAPGAVAAGQEPPDEGSPEGRGGSLTPAVGTRWYKAPELLLGGRGYSAAVDMWSVACVFAQLLSGKPLFPGSGDIDQLCRIVAALGSIREEAWPGVRDLPDWSKLQFPETAPQPLGALLPGCDPAGLELLQGLLQYNPEQRLTAAQALQSGYFSSQPVRAGPAALLAAVESVFPHAMRAQEPCTSCLGTHV